MIEWLVRPILLSSAPHPSARHAAVPCRHSTAAPLTQDRVCCAPVLLSGGARMPAAAGVSRSLPRCPPPTGNRRPMPRSDLHDREVMSWKLAAAISHASLAQLRSVCLRSVCLTSWKAGADEAYPTCVCARNRALRSEGETAGGACKNPRRSVDVPVRVAAPVQRQAPLQAADTAYV